MNVYIIDFIDISGYIHMICTLAQSHRLAWSLEPTGANLRVSGVQDKIPQNKLDGKTLTLV